VLANAMFGDRSLRVDRPHSAGIPKHIVADREALADPFKPAKSLQQPQFERLPYGFNGLSPSTVPRTRPV
jgi:hypothetical protein